MSQIIKNKKFLILLIILMLSFSFSLFSIAFGEELLVDWPPSPVPPELGGITLGPESTITELVAYLYQWGIALGGLVAFVALLIAGFYYMTSVGDPTKIKEATSRIKSAIGGLALLLGSWLILRIINPELTILRTPVLDLRAAITRCNDIGDCEQLQNKQNEREEKPGFPPELRGRIRYNCIIIDHDPDPDIKPGMCVRETIPPEIRPCDRVIVFEGTDYEHQGKVFDIMEGGWVPREVTLDEHHQSKRWFRDRIGSILFLKKYQEGDEGPRFNSDGTDNPNGDYVKGGACHVQLYKPGWFFGWGCGGRYLALSVSSPNTLGTVDGEIGCIRLVKHKPVRHE